MFLHEGRIYILHDGHDPSCPLGFLRVGPRVRLGSGKLASGENGLRPGGAWSLDSQTLGHGRSSYEPMFVRITGRLIHQARFAVAEPGTNGGRIWRAHARKREPEAPGLTIVENG